MQVELEGRMAIARAETLAALPDPNRKIAESLVGLTVVGKAPDGRVLARYRIVGYSGQGDLFYVREAAAGPRAAHMLWTLRQVLGLPEVEIGEAASAATA